MKAWAIERFRNRLTVAGDVLTGLWITLEAHAVADIASGLGLDWIVIENRCQQRDGDALCEFVRAAKRSETVVLIHVPSGSKDAIAGALHAGADGLVLSMAESTAELDDEIDYTVTYASRACKMIPYLEDDSAVPPQRPILFVAPGQCGPAQLEACKRIACVDGAFFNPFQATEKDQLGRHAGTRWMRREEDSNVLRALNVRAAAVAASVDEVALLNDCGVSLICLGVDAEILGASLHERLGSAEDFVAANRAAQDALMSAWGPA